MLKFTNLFLNSTDATYNPQVRPPSANQKRKTPPPPKPGGEVIVIDID